MLPTIALARSSFPIARDLPELQPTLDPASPVTGFNPKISKPKRPNSDPSERKANPLPPNNPVDSANSDTLPLVGSITPSVCISKPNNPYSWPEVFAAIALNDDTLSVLLRNTAPFEESIEWSVSPSETYTIEAAKEAAKLPTNNPKHILEIPLIRMSQRRSHPVQKHPSKGGRL
jgi:hypothetical protein